MNVPYRQTNASWKVPCCNTCIGIVDYIYGTWWICRLCKRWQER